MLIERKVAVAAETEWETQLLSLARKQDERQGSCGRAY